MCERECFKRRRGDAPIIATIILMAITVFTVFVTLTFVNSNLARREGESEFTLSKNFMRTVGLAVDDVAWKQGQTDSIPYGSKQSEMMMREEVISYTLTITYTDPQRSPETLPPVLTNALFYSLPLIHYSLQDGYFEELLPGKLNSIVQNGADQPSARVFAFQKNPIKDEGDYIRVGVISLPRRIEYSITTGSPPVSDKYLKLFIPILVKGVSTPSNPQYITLTGGAPQVKVYDGVESIRVRVDFPKLLNGYDNSLFIIPDIFFNNTDNPKGAVIDQELLLNGGRLEVVIGRVEVNYLQ
jgi:flagellin-like protein